MMIDFKKQVLKKVQKLTKELHRSPYKGDLESFLIFKLAILFQLQADNLRYTKSCMEALCDLLLPDKKFENKTRKTIQDCFHQYQKLWEITEGKDLEQHDYKEDPFSY